MMPLSLPKSSGAATADAGAWLDTYVSSRSRYSDDVWHLDIFVSGRPPANKRLRWDLVLSEESQITGEQHARLLRAAKQYLWSMALHPPKGRKRWSPSTLQGNGVALQVVVRWMAVDGVAAFRDLTPQAVERLVVWLRARPNHNGRDGLAPAAVGNYLSVVQTMFLQRAKLEDAPVIDPLRGETSIEAAGVSAASGGSIPYIPDAVAVDLLSKALTWVEVYSADILAAAALRRREVAKALARGSPRDSAGHAGARALRHAAMSGPDGRSFVRDRALQRCVTHLSTACFVVIAGFVGMRISEILSMRAGAAIERRRIGETGVEQAYIAARLFKGSDDPMGTPNLWAAPEPVERAVECLEALSALLRKDADRDDLFVAVHRLPTCIGSVTGGAITLRLRAFAREVDVLLHEGRAWPLSPHQFRKTFARFVARGDRSNLLALAKHFKHVSVAMTSRGYVGADFELHQLVDEETRAETALALNRLLSSPTLGGRMGERIVARNHAFRGRAGEQVRRDYIRFVLEETDLRVHACDYGWCVFQAETAQCMGERAPNEARRGPSVCSGCANFTVDDRHVPYWQDRRRRNQELLEQAGDRPLLRAAPEEALKECNRVLRGIEEGRGGRGAERNTSAPTN
jgi:integrase